jgi:DNA-directed RNA polymerase
MNNHALYAAQLQLEEEMRGFGIERYRKHVRDAREAGRETATSPVNRLVDETIGLVSEGISAFKAGIASAGPGRHHTAYPLIKDIDNDLLAYFTCKGILDSLSSTDGDVSHRAAEIGNNISEEMLFRAFKDQKFWSYKNALEGANKSPSMTYKRRHLKQIAKIKGVEFKKWNNEQAMKVGLKLCEIFIEKTGLVETKLSCVKGRKNDKINHFVTKPETLAWIEEVHRRREGMSPAYLPTIIPPRPWSSVEEGGYWGRGQGAYYRLVKTLDNAYLAKLDKLAMPEVYDALNVIQNTPWRINQRVLETIQEISKGFDDYGVIPSADPLLPPAKPFWLTEGMTKEHMTETQLAEFLRWKKEVKRTYELNAARTSHRIEFLRMMWIAEKFVSHSRIYFPHQLDFRGRVYPVPMLLNPQGPDLAKSLLQFADGKPLGTKEAVFWLAAHGAGCWGVDKVSFDERHQWVCLNEEAILAVAEDPLLHTFWTKADDPLMALAFCFEWAGYKREGFDYVCHLPVQMDGTCNGLQHFSAMLRDPVGGKAVNLLPGHRPSDIYQSVADVVTEQVKLDAAGEGDAAELAQGWLGNVTRKVTKRPVMTLAYGAKQFGFTDQVFYDTIIPWRDEKSDGFPFDGREHAAARYMAATIWSSVGQVVIAAKDAMSWLQAVTSTLSRAEKPIEWVTPVGFLVNQGYRKDYTKRIDTTLFGRRFTASVRKDGVIGTIDKRRQSNGVSPNFVHSMDGAHLMKTVNSCFQKHKIKHFSLIHDSYGAHACDAPLMAQVLRDEFVRMYQEHDVLSEFLENNLELLAGAEVPEMPAQGGLDLDMVRQSPYFFA